MALYVLVCKDLMINVRNSLVKTFTLFPKNMLYSFHVNGSRYWEILEVTFAQECGILNN